MNINIPVKGCLESGRVSECEPLEQMFANGGRPAKLQMLKTQG